MFIRFLVGSNNYAFAYYISMFVFVHRSWACPTQKSALEIKLVLLITMAGMPCAPPPPPKKKEKEKKKKKGKADLTTVLHIRELPHLHMELAVWFSFPTTNNKNPMIPSWSIVSIYNYSFSPDQILTKNFEILDLEICSEIFTCGIFLQVNSSLPTSPKKKKKKKKCVKPLNLVLCQSRNLS